MLYASLNFFEEPLLIQLGQPTLKLNYQALFIYGIYGFTVNWLREFWLNLRLLVTKVLSPYKVGL